MAADRRRLAELGMATELAKEVANQITNGTLQIGTTSTTAMAGNRTPTATIRGGVLQQTAQPDSTADEIAEVVADLNTLLGKLRAAGILAAS